MFKAGVIASTAFLASSVQGVYTYGKCPKISKDWQASHPGERLDNQKLSGDWFNFWESYVRQIHSDCLKMKLKPVDGQPNKLQQLTGISFREDDQVVFNDNKILSFSHPSDSSLASVHAIEEQHGDINEQEAIQGLSSLNLAELKEEVREKMDVLDIDLYDRIRDETQLLKDSILDGIEKGNRFTDPYQVLDTDYTNFLVTYQCRQVHRKPNEKDYIMSEGETFREFMEEYDSERHDKLLANHALMNNQENEAFDKLQMQIAADNNEMGDESNMTEIDYDKEIDTLMELDSAHRFHFAQNRPTVDEWKKRRQFYLDIEYDESEGGGLDDVYDEDKAKWFNSLQISVYVRNPEHYKDNKEAVKELKDRIKAKVPGYDFEAFHMETGHSNEKCLDGDIFEHRNAWRFSEIDQLKRTNPHTEADSKEGKLRPGDLDHLEIDGDDEEQDDDKAAEEMMKDMEGDDMHDPAEKDDL